jgi:hypothetical protein
MKYPKKLYRYTSLDKLALILKNKSIGLTPLEYLDDKVESMTKDLGSFGQDIFVSCWTSIEEEMLPFWKMYTKNMDGVRIGLNAPFFKTEKKEIVTINDKSIEVSKHYMPFKKKPGDIGMILSSELVKITYTDNEEELKPKVLLVDTEKTKYYEYGNMGKYKKILWKFQKEWRVRIIIPDPLIFNGNHKKKKELNNQRFYIEIDIDAFPKMEIMLGPKSKEGDMEILKTLTKMYNPTAIIKKSDLTGEIR